MDQTAPDRRETYLGDAQLGRLLSQANARFDVAGVRDVVAGVAAAPQSLDPEAWMALVAAEPGPQLRSQLRALLA